MTREVSPPDRARRLRRLGDDPRWLMGLSLGGLVLLGVVLVVAARLDVDVSSAAVAGVASALVVLFVASFRNRRVRTLGREGAEPVLALRDAVQDDMRRSPGQRRTGATHDSLSRVHDELERAYSELGAGHEGAAADRLRSLDRLTADWSPESGERAQALALVAHGDRVARVHDQNAATLRRRPSSRPGSRERVATPSSGVASPDPGELEARARRLTGAESFPDVVELLVAGDEIGATKAYRAHTHVGLADAQLAVRAAARRRGAALGDQ